MTEILRRGCEQMDLPMTDRQLAQLKQYAELLQERNKQVNLTAITEDAEIATKHFLDSLTALMTGKVGEHVIDVGTGAGFPGLVLKIARPQMQLTLLDSLKKRVCFLEDTALALELDGVACVHGRAEDFGMNAAYREKFDTAVSRAVAKLRVLAEWCLPFVRVGGYFLALKGPLADEELDEAKRAIYILGGEVESVFEAQIPFTELSHRIIIIKKVRRTPSKYPRKPGIAVKSPIETCYSLSKNK